MIERIKATEFRCLKNVETPRLGPIHAFIGPNDSGKSTLLEAVRLLCLIGSREDLRPENRGKQMVAAFWREVVKTPGFSLGLGTSEGWYRLTPHRETGAFEETLTPASEDKAHGIRREDEYLATSNAVLRMIRPAYRLRLDPDALRRRAGLIQGDSPIHFQDERGTGLPAVYDAIFNRTIERVAGINTEIRRLFPAVKAVRLDNLSTTEKAIAVELNDGTWVRAEQMSEGLLYYLAFAALRHTSSPGVLLIEEPENGLHPARIREVMRVLREVSTTSQVLIATHNPFVVNELQGDEVSVVTRTLEEGTKVTLLEDTPDFEARSRIYALGELWVSYANGDDEKPLFTAPPDPGEAGPEVDWVEAPDELSEPAS